MRRSEILIIRYRRTRIIESSPQAPVPIVNAETSNVSSEDSDIVAQSHASSPAITDRDRPSVWLELIKRILNR